MRPSGTFVRQCHESRPTLRANAGAGCLARCNLGSSLPTWLDSWTKHSKNPCLSSLLGHCAFWHVRNSEVSSFRLLDDKTQAGRNWCHASLQHTSTIYQFAISTSGFILSINKRHSAYKLPAVWGASRFTPNCQTPPTLNSGGKFEERANAETTFRDCLAAKNWNSRF